MRKILFVNASEHREGNTHQFGWEFLNGVPYEELALVDYKVFQLGQQFSDDQFNTVFHQLMNADEWVLGTPVYWHTISAYLKLLMERVSQMPTNEIKKLAGKRVLLLVQGADPSDTIGPATKLVKRFCDVLGLEFVGAATPKEKEQLQKEI